MAKTKKQVIHRNFLEQSGSSGPFLFYGKLDAVISSLVGIRDSIPEDFLKNTICTIESASDDPEYYESGHHPTISISGWREETDEEMQERNDKEKNAQKIKRAAQKAVRDAKEEKERAEFIRLSAKYGKKQ